MTRAVVPIANEAEAALVDGVEVGVAATLGELLASMRGEAVLSLARASTAAPVSPFVRDDLADIRGQSLARRALEVAAAGAHNLLFIGPPGAGKTMLVRTLARQLESQNVVMAQVVSTQLEADDPEEHRDGAEAATRAALKSPPRW